MMTFRLAAALCFAATVAIAPASSESFSIAIDPGFGQSFGLTPRAIAPPTSDETVSSPWNIATGGVGWVDTVTEGTYATAFDAPGDLILTRVVACSLAVDPDVTGEVTGLVYDSDGPGGTPGTLLAQSEPRVLQTVMLQSLCTSIAIPGALEVPSGHRVYPAVQWDATQDPDFFLVSDSDAGTPQSPIFGNGGGGWNDVRTTFPEINALAIETVYVDLDQIDRTCTPNATTMCLNNERFRVQIDHRRVNDNRAPGQVVPLGSDDSGLFYFFDPANWEMLIKVLKACGPPFDKYWVFYAATTNVEFNLLVTDTEAQTVRMYTNPLGQTAPTITDTSAFATCP